MLFQCHHNPFLVSKMYFGGVFFYVTLGAVLNWKHVNKPILDEIDLLLPSNPFCIDYFGYLMFLMPL